MCKTNQQSHGGSLLSHTTQNNFDVDICRGAEKESIKKISEILRSNDKNAMRVTPLEI